jgi:hypothetical protein
MSSVKVSKEIKKFSEYEKLVQGFHQHITGNTPIFLGRMLRMTTTILRQW